MNFKDLIESGEVHKLNTMQSANFIGIENQKFIYKNLKITKC